MRSSFQELARQRIAQERAKLFELQTQVKAVEAAIQAWQDAIDMADKVTQPGAASPERT